MDKITTYLWFDTQAEDAANFYTSLFKNSRIGSVSRYPEGMPDVGGKVMSVDFELEGRSYIALNGGPMFKFTEAISLFVSCEDQAEVDHFWNALIADGGAESMCGWLKDKYGLSWQIIPKALMRLMSDPDKEKAGRAVQAMLQMKKIVVADLEKAHAGV